MEIKHDVPLSKYTTFKTGGLARLFCIVRSLTELREVCAYAQKESIPMYPLGGGSNVLAGSRGFDGIVIKIEIEGIEIVEEDSEYVRVDVGAGVEWDVFVAHAVGHGWYGIENLSLIPGSVGAAPIQNIGAYGTEVKDVIDTVQALDAHTGIIKLKTFSREECAFGYRDSFFKTEEGKRYIITHVTFKLAKTPTLNTSYKDIEQYFATHTDVMPTLQTVRDAVIDVRTHKLPDWHTVGTAGSFFKNPIILRTEYDSLQKIYTDMPAYKVGDAERIKTSAAFLIDKVAGLKGVRMGDVSTYNNQALVIVQDGNATGEDVLAFSQMIIDSVYKKTNVLLEREVQTLGF